MVKKYKILWMSLVLGVLCSLMMTLGPTAADDLPGLPTPPGGLPEFPTPPGSETPKPATMPEIAPPAMAGANLALHVQGADNGDDGEWLWWRHPWQNVFTVMEWQDADGVWHTVPGWQGTLDSVQNLVGTKTWWISDYDFGTGPFRWLVYAHQGGALIGMSEDFMLSAQTNRTLVVEVEIAP